MKVLFASSVLHILVIISYLSQCSHILKNWHYNLQKKVSTVESGQQPVTSKSTTTVYVHEWHSCIKLVNDTNIWHLAQLFLKQCFATRSLSQGPVNCNVLKIRKHIFTDAYSVCPVKGKEFSI